MLDDLAQTAPPEGGQKNKPNLRTCGRYVGEKTAPYRAKVKRTESVPTIPSRFETTVYKGYREVLGFGSHALRWQEPASNHAPGPGAYGQQKTFHEDCSERTSWGIRGTGGFASHSTRLGARSVPSMPVAGRGVPGPGKYEEMNALQAMRSAKDFNQARMTAVFAKPVDKQVTHQMPKPEPEPGPGHYPQSGVKVYSQEPSAASVGFRSRCSRVGQGRPPAAENPGPGEYSDAARAAFPATASSGELSAAFQARLNAVFQTPSKPRILRIHPDLPTASHSGREVLGELADEVGRECGGAMGSNAKMPGPGAYEVNRDEMFEPGLVGANGSSSFQPGPKRTEWANLEVQRKPGPGRYDPNMAYVAPEKLTSAKSAFESTTDRGKYELTASPGPAFYNPKQPKTSKSFRLRSTDLWVA